MVWPTSTDYMDTIQNPKFCFKDSDLANGIVESTSLGLPKVISGGFANVYRIKSGGKDWAVRCFLREFLDQKERYEVISNHLKSASLPYMVDFQYLKEGIKVSGEWFPVLKMQWIEGEALNEYIAKNVQNPQALLELSVKWKNMMEALKKHNIAHGDLQHGNILVYKNDLKLIDYDAMYVPQLAGKVSNEIGHRNYQHPKRTELDFGPYTDNFSAIIIYSTLMALTIDPELWKKVGAGDEYLFFRKEDFDSPRLSDTLHLLKGHHDNTINDIADTIEQLLTVDTRYVPYLDQSVVKVLTVKPQSNNQASSWIDSHLQSLNSAPKPTSDDYTYLNTGTWVLDYVQEKYPESNRRFKEGNKTCRISVLLASIGIGIIPFLQLSSFLPVPSTLAIPSEILLVDSLILYIFYVRNPLVINRRKIVSEFNFENDLYQSSLSEAKKIDQSIAKINVAQKQGYSNFEKLKQKFQKDEKEQLNRVQNELQLELNNVRSSLQRLVKSENDDLNKVRTKYSQHLATLTDNLNSLTNKETVELESELQRIQNQVLNDYLRRFSIANASITGIGPTYTARLIAAGFTTAADINYYKVQHVSGIGQSRAADLIAWRQSLENRVPVPSSLTPIQMQTIKSKYDNQKRTLENNLSGLHRQQSNEETSIRNQYSSQKISLDKAIQDAQNNAKAEVENIKLAFTKKYDEISQQLQDIDTTKDKERQEFVSKKSQVLSFGKESSWKAERLKRDLSDYCHINFKGFVLKTLFNKEVS